MDFFLSYNYSYKLKGLNKLKKKIIIIITLAINSTNIISIRSITTICAYRAFKHIIRLIASLASSRIATYLTIANAFYEKNKMINYYYYVIK